MPVATIRNLDQLRVVITCNNRRGLARLLRRRCRLAIGPNSIARRIWMVAKESLARLKSLTCLLAQDALTALQFFGVAVLPRRAVSDYVRNAFRNIRRFYLRFRM